MSGFLYTGAEIDRHREEEGKKEKGGGMNMKQWLFGTEGSWPAMKMDESSKRFG